MTVNDITLRSQEMAQRNAMFQDQRRDDAYGKMGQAAQQLGAQLIDNQRYAQHQQDLAREFALQKADADSRLALQQQEMQMNQIKLQQMAQIDAVDMSRQQLEQMKLHNQALTLDIEQKKKMFESTQQATTQQSFARVVNSLNGLEWATLGYRPDPTTNTFVKLDDEEKGKLIDVLKKQATARDTTDQERRMAESLIRTGENTGDEAMVQEGRRRMSELAGVPVAAATAPKPKMTEERRAQIENTAKQIRIGLPTGNPMNDLANNQSLMGLGGFMKSEDAGKISSYLWSNIDGFVQAQQRGFDADPQRKGLKANPEGTIKTLLEIINNPNHPRHQALMDAMRRDGVIQ